MDVKDLIKEAEEVKAVNLDEVRDKLFGSISRDNLEMCVLRFMELIGFAQSFIKRLGVLDEFHETIKNSIFADTMRIYYVFLEGIKANATSDEVRDEWMKKMKLM